MDPWLPSIPGFCPVQCSSWFGGIDEDLRMNSLFNFTNGEWNLDVGSNMFSYESVEAIAKLSKLDHLREDVWVWLDDPKGRFSVAGTYWKTRQWSMHDYHPLQGKDWQWLWRLKIQDRLKLFLWKCLHSAIPLRGLFA